MMRQTSLEVYHNHREKFTQREKAVYHALNRLGGQATAWQILDYFGWANPNYVRPRLTGLRAKGWVKETGKMFNPSHKCTEIVWSIA